jgi:hypothetical protein
LGLALTAKPGGGWQIPIEGSTTWTSGPQPGATETTSSTRFNAGIGLGKLGLFGLPFLGAYAGISNEAVLPPFTPASNEQKTTTGTLGVGGVF